MDFIKEPNRVYANDTTGNLIAEITFPNSGDTYCINHTFVDDSLRGQGVAGQLVQMAVDIIKENGGQVTATCSYAKHWLEKQ